MFDHVTLRVSGLDASARFYETVLPVLGIADPARNGFLDWGELSIAEATAERPVTRGAHLGLSAPSRELVDEFWRVGTAAGYVSDGDPGPRPKYRRDYYGAFLLDPDGNSIEAVHHGGVGGQIDHVWLRVADVAASRAFYELVAPFGSFSLKRDEPEHAQFVAEPGSISFVAGTPSENVHLAFPAADDETVGAFHRALVRAGSRDEGAPGERTVYHAGYYAAYVLDPDGNVVELVNHNR